MSKIMRDHDAAIERLTSDDATSAERHAAIADLERMERDASAAQIAEWERKGHA